MLFQPGATAHSHDDEVDVVFGTVLGDRLVRISFEQNTFVFEVRLSQSEKNRLEDKYRRLLPATSIAEKWVFEKMV